MVNPPSPGAFTIHVGMRSTKPRSQGTFVDRVGRYEPFINRDRAR
jgi:ribosomal protein S16